MYFSKFFALHVYWGTSSNVKLSQKCFPLLLRRHCVIFVWLQKKLISTEINFCKAYFLRELKFVYFAFSCKSTRNILKILKSIEICLYNVLSSKLLLYWKICLSLFKLRKKNFRNIRIISQPAITCSKLTTEALEQGVKYVQS